MVLNLYLKDANWLNRLKNKTLPRAAHMKLTSPGTTGIDWKWKDSKKMEYENMEE